MRELVQLLQQVFGQKLASVCTYGHTFKSSVSQGDEVLRTVAVLHEVDLESLRGFSQFGPRLGGKRLMAPLILTPDFIDASRDSFPLELLEIQQTQKTIFGTEYFASLVLENEHIRLQVERELKRLQMRMQQGLLAAAGHEPSIELLEMDIAEHALRTLMGLLWLKGHRESLQGDEVIAACEKLTSRALPGLRAGLNPAVEHGWKEFQALYHDIEALAAIANA